MKNVGFVSVIWILCSLIRAVACLYRLKPKIRCSLCSDKSAIFPFQEISGKFLHFSALYKHHLPPLPLLSQETNFEKEHYYGQEKSILLGLHDTGTMVVR